jgi:hypothetical protein
MGFFTRETGIDNHEISVDNREMGNGGSEMHFINREMGINMCEIRFFIWGIRINSHERAIDIREMKICECGTIFANWANPLKISFQIIYENRTTAASI